MRFAVEAGAGAVAIVVDDVVVEVADLDTDGEGVLGVIGVLRGDDEAVACEGDGGAVMGAGFEDARFVAHASGGKTILFEEEDVAVGVGEDGDPAVDRGVVDGELVGDVEETGDRVDDEVFVVAVGTV